MPRKLRVEYPGAMYRVMSRGDRREDIFLGDADRQDFRKTLAEVCQKTGWQVHAYSLMRNHCHLVIETPHGNLAADIAWRQSTCTIGYRQSWVVDKMDEVDGHGRGGQGGDNKKAKENGVCPAWNAASFVS